VWPRRAQEPSFGARATLALLELAGCVIVNDPAAFDDASPASLDDAEIAAELARVGYSGAELEAIAAEAAAVGAE
jgi:hypothetical protein